MASQQEFAKNGKEIQTLLGTTGHHPQQRISQVCQARKIVWFLLAVAMIAVIGQRVCKGLSLKDATSIRHSTLINLETLASAQHSTCAYEGFPVPADFGFMTGSWMGSCNDDPVQAKCAITQVAQDPDGNYIGGLEVTATMYKMVKFKADGTRVFNSAKYYQGAPPASAREMALLYHSGNGRPADNYQFVKGNGFLCPKCEIQGFLAPADFGYMTGLWTGSCKDDFAQAECAITHIAKDLDGDYIGGLHVDKYFKMVKFKANGIRVPGSARYLEGGSPASLEEMRLMYQNGNGRPGDNYQFIKGSGFPRCQHTTTMTTTAEPLPCHPPAPGENLDFPALQSGIGFNAERDIRYKRFATGRGGNGICLREDTARRACAQDKTCLGVSCRVLGGRCTTMSDSSRVAQNGWISDEIIFWKHVDRN